MLRELPSLLELSPYQGCESTLEGVLSTERMGRIQEVGEVAPEAGVSLTLSAETRGDIALAGRVESRIQLTCQRCLDPVEVALVSDFEFVVMDAADAQPGDEESADIIVTDDGMVRLRELVEDELLLALPVVARHDDANPCRPRVQQFGPPDEPAPKAENPFAVLERLKGDRDE